MNRSALTIFALASACARSVASEEAAEAAYRGLDHGVSRALELGMDGFNAANSANIPSQTGEGDLRGTLTVTGNVDQGVSDNKGMRLAIALLDYQDVAEPDTWYATLPGELPEVDLRLRNIPDGTFTGTLTGVVEMEGELTGAVALSVALSGEIEADPDLASGVRRVAGTTSITGSAASVYGVYPIDFVW